ncbi:hypothetical protein B0T20DRAFT_478750 [Sordaria brevicollis]|uniref:Uncharacterized protein n=1 Tax=Sordaria brevicollis TaxID=83679 RepID=A0AAE0PH35_SORBR|nr:hypothetical protein B0T20DRAFT_478750 [Sordaria brevicollis]
MDSVGGADSGMSQPSKRRRVEGSADGHGPRRGSDHGTHLDDHSGEARLSLQPSPHTAPLQNELQPQSSPRHGPLNTNEPNYSNTSPHPSNNSTAHATSSRKLVMRPKSSNRAGQSASENVDIDEPASVGVEMADEMSADDEFDENDPAQRDDNSSQAVDCPSESVGIQQEDVNGHFDTVHPAGQAMEPFDAQGSVQQHPHHSSGSFSYPQQFHGQAPDPQVGESPISPLDHNLPDELLDPQLELFSQAMNPPGPHDQSAPQAFDVELGEQHSPAPDHHPDQHPQADNVLVIHDHSNQVLMQPSEPHPDNAPAQPLSPQSTEPVVHGAPVAAAEPAPPASPVAVFAPAAVVPAAPAPPAAPAGVPDAPAVIPAAAQGQAQAGYICRKRGCDLPRMYQTPRARFCRTHLSNTMPLTRVPQLNNEATAAADQCSGCNSLRPRRAPGKTCWDCYCKAQRRMYGNCAGCPGSRCPNMVNVEDMPEGV